MTDAICYRDSYARRIEAQVITVERPAPRAPWSSSTRPSSIPVAAASPRTGVPSCAPPTAGAGQVRAARREAGEIVHELEPGDAQPPRPGDRLEVDLDWDRRHLLMRTHTALHALCGVVWRDYGAQVTGGNMEPGSGRMDFEFERLNGELVGAIEATVNQELARGREIRVNVLPRDAAFAIPDLIRTKVNLLPAGISEIRTVEIVGLDLQADGGTHVASTTEVGRIRVTGYESKGRINKRIRIELVDAPADGA